MAMTPGCLSTVDTLSFFFSSRRRHTRFDCDWSSDVCSSDLIPALVVHRWFAGTHEFHEGAQIEFRRSPYVATCEPPVDNQSWYALHIRHQHEKTAARILENQGYEFFLPLYMARRKWQGRLKQVALPPFPRHLLVRG